MSVYFGKMFRSTNRRIVQNALKSLKAKGVTFATATENLGDGITTTKRRRLAQDPDPIDDVLGDSLPYTSKNIYGENAQVPVSVPDTPGEETLKNFWGAESSNSGFLTLFTITEGGLRSNYTRVTPVPGLEQKSFDNFSVTSEPLIISDGVLDFLISPMGGPEAKFPFTEVLFVLTNDQQLPSFQFEINDFAPTKAADPDAATPLEKEFVLRSYNCTGAWFARRSLSAVPLGVQNISAMTVNNFSGDRSPDQEKDIENYQSLDKWSQRISQDYDNPEDIIADFRQSKAAQINFDYIGPKAIRTVDFEPAPEEYPANAEKIQIHSSINQEVDPPAAPPSIDLGGQNLGLGFDVIDLTNGGQTVGALLPTNALYINSYLAKTMGIRQLEADGTINDEPPNPADATNYVYFINQNRTWVTTYGIVTKTWWVTAEAYYDLFGVFPQNAASLHFPMTQFFYRFGIISTDPEKNTYVRARVTRRPAKKGLFLDASKKPEDHAHSEMPPERKSFFADIAKQKIPMIPHSGVLDWPLKMSDKPHQQRLDRMMTLRQLKGQIPESTLTPTFVHAPFQITPKAMFRKYEAWILNSSISRGKTFTDLLRKGFHFLVSLQGELDGVPVKVNEIPQDPRERREFFKDALYVIHK